MAFIKKEKAGSGGGYVWPKDGDVVEVDDETATELTHIPDGGFSEASPKAKSDIRHKITEPDPDAEPDK